MVSDSFLVKTVSQHSFRGNGFFTGKDPVEDTSKSKHFKALLGIRSVDRSIVLVVEAVWKATGVLPRSLYLLSKSSRVDIKR